MLGALGAARTGGADLGALGAERLIATSAAEVRRFFGMLVAKPRFVGRRPLLVLGVFGKIESATSAEPDIVFVFSGAAGANLHEDLKVIMP